MTKNLIILLSLTFALSTVASVEDLAIDPKNGDTVVVQRSQNPNGEVTFLNDKD